MKCYIKLYDMYNTCDNYIVAFCITHPHHTGISFLVYCHFFWSSFSLPFGCLVSFHRNEYGSVRKFVRNRLHWARAVHSEWSTCVFVCVFGVFFGLIWFDNNIKVHRSHAHTKIIHLLVPTSTGFGIGPSMTDLHFISCCFVFFFHQKIHTESTQFSVIVNNI